MRTPAPLLNVGLPTSEPPISGKTTVALGTANAWSAVALLRVGVASFSNGAQLIAQAHGRTTTIVFTQRCSLPIWTTTKNTVIASGGAA